MWVGETRGWWEMGYMDVEGRTQKDVSEVRGRPKWDELALLPPVH